MASDKERPGRFPEERQEPDSQSAGSEGGGPEDPDARDPHAPDAREEAKKRASRYVMEDPEESGARKRREKRSEDGGEKGFGNESRPHTDAPIREEKRMPDEDEPMVDQEDEAWDRIDRDSF